MMLLLMPCSVELVTGGSGTALAQQRQRTPRIRRRMSVQLIQRGLRLMHDKRYAEAASAFAQAQRLYPSERALFLLGQAYDLAGQPAQADSAFRQIPARAQSRLAEELRRRGVDHMGKGRYVEAIADFQLAGRLSSGAQLTLLLGQAFELAGRLDDALKAYKLLRGRPLRTVDRQVVAARIDAVEKRLQMQTPQERSTKPLPPQSMPTDIETARVNLGDRRDDDILAGDETDGASATPSAEATKEDAGKKKLIDIGTDKLQIGGVFYARFEFSFTNGNDVSTDDPFSMPNFTDIYLDARPTDRLRAFIITRLSYNPSIPPVDPLNTTPRDQISFSLTEYWLKFDIARRVFLTVGKQLVHWGSSRLWNPIDVINTVPKPIFDPVDERGGVMMVKLHVPVESLGWNFYTVALLDGVDSLDRWGVAARGEFVFSTVELGLTGAYRKAVDPKVGLDFSAGIWNFDLYSEAAVRFGQPSVVLGNVVTDGRDIALQVSGGLLYTIRVFESDQLILGAEYFYNQDGSAHPDPLKLFTGEATPLYMGRHYGALTLTLPAPGRLDDWTFVGLAGCDFSDMSAAAQLMVSVKLLTYLQLRALVTGHFGKQGELRIGDLAFPTNESAQAARRLWYRFPANEAGGTSPAALVSGVPPVPTQIVDFSLWLSVDI